MAPGGPGWAQRAAGIFAQRSQTQGRPRQARPQGNRLRGGGLGHLPVGLCPLLPLLSTRWGKGIISEQTTHAVNGLAPWLQQDTWDRNSGRGPGTGRQSHQECPPVPGDSGTGVSAQARMTTLGGQALRTGQRWVEPPTYLGGHTGNTQKPFSKDGSGIPNRMAGGRGGNQAAAAPGPGAGSAVPP